jgi:protein-disulfide isomerase
VAQSAPPDLVRKIEHQVRSFYNMPPEVKLTVGTITPTSEVPGYDSVTVNIDGGDGKAKDYKFLISSDRNTLLRVTKFDLTKDPFAELMGKIDVSGRPTRGAKSAKVVAINYDDFECPYCARMHQALFSEIIKEYGDRVTFIYKDYPLEFHPWAIHAAVDANCLASQNNDAYWDFADGIHATKTEVDNLKTPTERFDAIDKLAVQQGQKHNVDAAKLQACLKAQNEDAVRASVREADALGVNATPTLFINGQRIDGAVPVAQIRSALDAALKDAWQPVPNHAPAAGLPGSTPADKPASK